jgi:hypothetical protein
LRARRRRFGSTQLLPYSFVRGNLNAYQLFLTGGSRVVKGCQGGRIDLLKRFGRVLVGSHAIAQSDPRAPPDPVPPWERQHANQSGIHMRLVTSLLLATLPASAWAACALRYHHRVDQSANRRRMQTIKVHRHESHRGTGQPLRRTCGRGTQDYRLRSSRQASSNARFVASERRAHSAG